MSRSPDRDRLELSVFERLTDRDPTKAADERVSSAQRFEQVRESFRADLLHLLNTRGRSIPIPEAYEGLSSTIVGYGIRDFAGHSFGARKNRQEFLRQVERLLIAHEPRFKSVTVRPLENSADEIHLLKFRIEAVIYAYPAPEELVFDSQVEPIARSFSVTA